MKKKLNHIYKIALAGLLVTGLGACKKSFLEVLPKGTVIAATADDYGRLLSNASLMNTPASPPQVILGDEMAAVKSFFDNATTREQRLFRWDAVVQEPAESATELDGLMTNIYLFNKIINEVLASDGPETQKKSLRAEALVGRAWTNFILINYYGKPYHPATAAKDPGFPLVNFSDVTQTEFTRGTVQEVYNQIIKDLETAIPDLPENLSRRIRASRPLGKALLGKVYMFMQQFDKALPLLNAAFDELALSAVAVRLYDYTKTFATGGSFLPIAALGGPAYPNTSSNEENIYAKQFTNPYSFFNNTFVIAPSALKLFKSGDLRLKFYVNKQYPSGALPPQTLRRSGPSLVQAGFVLPELYLLRAECRVRANNLTGAVEDVETLRKNRMPSGEVAIPTDTATNKMNLLHYIMEERTREFAAQGFRWFDMRRLSVDPLFAGISFKHFVYDTDGSATSYDLKPERFVLRFPQKVMEQNPTMQNNP